MLQRINNLARKIKQNTLEEVMEPRIIRVTIIKGTILDIHNEHDTNSECLYHKGDSQYGDRTTEGAR